MKERFVLMQRDNMELCQNKIQLSLALPKTFSDFYIGIYSLPSEQNEKELLHRKLL